MLDAEMSLVRKRIRMISGAYHLYLARSGEDQCAVSGLKAPTEQKEQAEH
ncbi:MAG: hypothetical protein BroJett029_04900 [Alphaproteobacteria bacterium]|mgnify:CR=1 FL=1|jgi:hypothetical protein|nr:MAG: hypothetical protein BroJett029_04900 [Alphaproteobacteria bacterium]